MKNAGLTEFQAVKTAYGIRAEKSFDGVFAYVAYRFDLDESAGNRAARRYAYSMMMKRWKTLEIALMHYSVMGIACFPVFGRRPDSICEKEMLRLIDVGFDEMLKRTQGA